MKNTRKLIPAIAMLMVSAVMLTTASYAWFSMSTEATATGMHIAATADSSMLIIDAKDIAKIQAGDFSDADGSIELKADTPALAPAISEEGALKTLDNTDEVDPATGLLPDGVNPEYSDAQENTNYIEYVVAVGVTGQAKSGTLTVAVDATVEKILHNAASIDFWATVCTGETVGTPEYKGTVTFKDIATKSTVELAELTDFLTLEEEALQDYVLVTMKVYFDGEMLDGQGNAYARNFNITDATAAFDVTFTIAE